MKNKLNLQNCVLSTRLGLPIEDEIDYQGLMLGKGLPSIGQHTYVGVVATYDENTNQYICREARLLAKVEPLPSIRKRTSIFGGNGSIVTKHFRVNVTTTVVEWINGGSK